MGYSHGHKWTDDRIKDSLLQVVKGLQLDRMPSRKEVYEFTNNCALTNAISRRKGGWYGLARDLGLSIKKSDTYLGKEYEAIIYSMLLEKGFEATQMSQNFPYDILVNKSVKIDVKVSHLYKGNAGNFYSFRIGKKYATCDVYILVAIDDENTINDIFIVPSIEVINNSQISIGEKDSKYSKFLNNWESITKYSTFMREEKLL